MTHLGISQAQMCQLSYTVSVPYSINQIYSGQNLGFSDAREVVSDERVLYRGEGDVGPGRLRVDAQPTLCL